MVDQDVPPTPGRFDGARIARKVAIVVVLVLVGYLVYKISAAYFPRKWAQYVGGLSNGELLRGSMWGVFFGFVFSFFPVLLLLQVRRGFLNWPWRIAVALAAIALAVPNWLTLSVVAGASSAAHAGERIMDVEAPGFRGGTLAGVITGVTLALILAAITWNLGRRRRQVKELKSELKDREQAAVNPVTEDDQV